MNTMYTFKGEQKEYDEKFNELSAASPCWKAFDDLIDYLWTSPNDSYVTTYHLLDIMGTANWQGWFRRNSIECILNGRFLQICLFESRRDWMSTMSSKECSEECLKRALKIIIRYMKDHRLVTVRDFYETGDPMSELIDHLGACEQLSDMRACAVDNKTIGLIKDIGGDDLVEYWYKCLDDTDLVTSSHILINKL